jgi:hypothetical protein
VDDQQRQRLPPVSGNPKQRESGQYDEFFAASKCATF